MAQFALAEVDDHPHHLERIEEAKLAVERIKPDDDDALTSALAAKRKAFSTYAPLSLDAERDRILASYRR